VSGPRRFCLSIGLCGSTLASPLQISVIRMARTKNEVLTIRTTAEVKALLKLAAERERRSAASMIEVLVLDYAKAHGLDVSSTDWAAKKSRHHDE
jgi:hypothetical protein